MDHKMLQTGSQPLCAISDCMCTPTIDHVVIPHMFYTWEHSAFCNLQSLRARPRHFWWLVMCMSCLYPHKKRLLKLPNAGDSILSLYLYTHQSTQSDNLQCTVVESTLPLCISKNSRLVATPWSCVEAQELLQSSQLWAR